MDTFNEVRNDRKYAFQSYNDALEMIVVILALTCVGAKENLAQLVLDVVLDGPQLN